MSETRLIVVRMDENIKDYTDITMPTIRAYAEKCNATLMILNHEPLLLTADLKKHYRILQIRSLLNDVDRVLSLDADILIQSNCPNLFERVPVDEIGSIYEDKGTRRIPRKRVIDAVQMIWGEVGWKEGYTNAGCFLLSKQHSNIFDPHKGEYWCQFGSADVHMGYNIAKNDYLVHELSFQFNHMPPFSEDWNGNANRFDSFIIHYAGKGVFNDQFKNKTEQIKADIKYIT